MAFFRVPPLHRRGSQDGRHGRWLALGVRVRCRRLVTGRAEAAPAGGRQDGAWARRSSRRRLPSRHLSPEKREAWLCGWDGQREDAAD
jgi:hypothetical protein